MDLASIAAAMASWILGAVIVVGIMQTAKNALPALEGAAGWVKALIAVVLAVGVGLARYFGAEAKPAEGPLWTCLGIIAVSQTCYEAIYRGIIRRGAAFADGEPPAAAGGK
jgi:hypothetical protein